MTDDEPIQEENIENINININPSQYYDEDLSYEENSSQDQQQDKNQKEPSDHVCYTRKRPFAKEFSKKYSQLLSGRKRNKKENSYQKEYVYGILDRVRKK